MNINQSEIDIDVKQEAVGSSKASNIIRAGIKYVFQMILSVLFILAIFLGMAMLNVEGSMIMGFLMMMLLIALGYLVLVCLLLLITMACIWATTKLKAVLQKK